MVASGYNKQAIDKKSKLITGGDSLNEFKWAMACNVLIQVSFAFFVTVAAIKFGRTGLLWWYLLLPLLGYDFTVRREGGSNDHS